MEIRTLRIFSPSVLELIFLFYFYYHWATKQMLRMQYAVVVVDSIFHFMGCVSIIAISLPCHRCLSLLDRLNYILEAKYHTYSPHHLSSQKRVCSYDTNRDLLWT